jgi:hypothetical protein
MPEQQTDGAELLKGRLATTEAQRDYCQAQKQFTVYIHRLQDELFLPVMRRAMELMYGRK